MADNPDSSPDGGPDGGPSLQDVLLKSQKEFFDTLMKTSPMNAGMGTAAKLFRGNDVYSRLYEFWEPLARALQEKTFDPDSYKNLLDPGKYAEMIDGVFGFGSPASVTDFCGHASGLVDTWASRAQDFVKPWSDALEKNVGASAALASGDPEARMQVFDSLRSAFEETFGKALNMPAVGKDRELTELLLKTIDRYSVFLAKSSEFQLETHKIAQQAMDRVVEIVAEKVRRGEKIEGIEQFAKIWTETNEKAFHELFKTEQFARLQGLLLDAALDARRHIQQLMEHGLKDFPIALRSDMDDVYKTSYTLNKSVRALQRKSLEIDRMREEIERLEQRVASLEHTTTTDNRVK